MLFEYSESSLVHHMCCNGTDVTKTEMYSIELHIGIRKIIDGYNRLGLWHRGDDATIKETRIKIFYSIYSLLFPIASLAGAISSDDKDESTFLLEVAILCIIVCVKLFYIIWRKKEIFELLHRIGVYSIKEKEDFIVVDDKLRSFMKWIAYFYCYAIFMGAFVALIAPFIGSDKKLFFNVSFPLDHKNNEFGFWIAFLFTCTEIFLGVVSFSFSIIVWYLMFNCGLKYEVLGSELENMGVVRTVDADVKKRKISEMEKRNFFKRDLIAGIESHKDINEYTRVSRDDKLPSINHFLPRSTQQLSSFLSNMFSIQLATSAFCICVSVYSLAFVSQGQF